MERKSILRILKIHLRVEWRIDVPTLQQESNVQILCWRWKQFCIGETSFKKKVLVGLRVKRRGLYRIQLCMDIMVKETYS